LTESPARRLIAAFVDLVFGHDGRIGRLRYWLGLMAATAIVGFAAGLADGAVPGTGDIGRYVAFVFIVGLMIWTHSAVTVKRLHDRNRSGLWYFLYGLAPPVLLLWAIYLHAEKQFDAASPMYVFAALGFFWVTIELGLMRGTAGPNRFGPHKQRQS